MCFKSSHHVEGGRLIFKAPEGGRVKFQVSIWEGLRVPGTKTNTTTLYDDISFKANIL